MESESGHEVDEGEAGEAEEADAELGDEEKERGVVGEFFGEVAADEGAEAEAEHEEADDDGGGFDVDAEGGE